jgi:hypothetical protein
MSLLTYDQSALVIRGCVQDQALGCCCIGLQCGKHLEARGLAFADDDEACHGKQDYQALQGKTAPTAQDDERIKTHDW